MSIFGSILSSIFGSARAEEVTPQTSAGNSTSAGATASSQPTAAATSSASSTPAAKAAAPSAPVDVAAILDGLTRSSGLKDIQWRKSIVDLMKLLKLDSGLSARRELAKELNYTGDTKDTATMNVWLHKQVMTKLAENGGVVPDDLKS